MPHTPGPWMLVEGRMPLVMASNVFISAPSSGTGRHDEVMGNARLIAAAPDLLAICEELEEAAAYWSEYDVPLGIVDRLKAAIRKAKGVANDTP